MESLAQDREFAVAAAAAKLTARARDLGFQTLTLPPIDGDFNDDRRLASHNARRLNALSQLKPIDVVHFEGP